MAQIDIIKTYAQKKCLVIDDFANFRGSIKRMLQNFGAKQVDVATTGEEAVNRCMVNSYDIILSDYNLGPGKSGQQLLEELRHRKLLRNTSLFVMITAETAKARVMCALEELPDGYLTKPFTQRVLQKRLDTMLMQKEELRDINEALDDEDIELAIQLCNDKIAARSKYSTWCLKLKSQILFQQQHFGKAKRIYEKVIDNRPLDWARLGLGKVELMLKNYDEAEELFTGLIKENPANVDAYDWLAKSLEVQRQIDDARSVVDQAVQISPEAIMRQQHLGELSMRCGELKSAVTAFGHAVELGKHSCHDSSDNYMNLSRCLTQQLEQITEQDTDADKPQQLARKQKPFQDKLDKILERAQRRFKDEPEVNIQSQLIKARALTIQGQEDQAKDMVSSAQKAYRALNRDPSVDISNTTSLDLARGLIAVGKHYEAADLLTSLGDQFPGDHKLNESIEEMMNLPELKEKRKEVVGLNKKGIRLFEEQKYPQAVKVFSDAIKLCPRHIGLNLNLVQSFAECAKKSGKVEDYRDQCMECLQRVKHLSKDHKQYPRYKNLRRLVVEM